MTEFKSFDFSKILEENVKNYNGDHSQLIKNANHIFDLMVTLVDESDLPQSLRLKLFSVIGYFILPKDLYPEDEHGAIGYIDDLLISIHVLKDIISHYDIEMLQQHWEKDHQLLDNILNEYFNEAQTEYIQLYNELVEYMGF